MRVDVAVWLMVLRLAGKGIYDPGKPTLAVSIGQAIGQSGTLHHKSWAITYRVTPRLQAAGACIMIRTPCLLALTSRGPLS
jgi:hypothetical protein